MIITLKEGDFEVSIDIDRFFSPYFHTEQFHQDFRLLCQTIERSLIIEQVKRDIVNREKEAKSL